MTVTLKALSVTASAAILILSGCTKAEEPIATSKPSEPITGAALGAMATPVQGNINVNCPAKFLCETLVSETSSCEADVKSKSCDSFIQTTKKLTGKYDCQRDFDKSAVPALWLCEQKSQGLHERVITVLAKLTSPAANELFKSDAFQSTLDGHAGELYREISPKRK